MSDYANNRNSQNHAYNVKKYQKKFKRVFVLVDPNDKEVCKWLDQQKNKSEAVRSLIRQSVERKKKQREANDKLREGRRNAGLCIFCGKPNDRAEDGKYSCQACADRRKVNGK